MLKSDRNQQWKRYSWSQVFGSLLCLLLSLAGCDTDLLYVQVSNLPGLEEGSLETLDLRLYINGQRYKRIEPISDPASMRRFVLKLPANTVGEIELQIDGMSRVGLVTTRGSAYASLVPQRVVPSSLQVALMPQSEPLVRLIIERHDELGELELMDLPCERSYAAETLCYLSPEVLMRARAKPRENAYSDWGGACGLGELECVMRADRSRSFRLLPRACSKEGWCWHNSLPHGSQIRGAWGSSANDVWAVGDSGTLLHFDGDRWQAHGLPTTKELTGVWGTSATDVWAFGFDGQVFHYDGVRWDAVEVNPKLQIYSAWGSSQDDVYFAAWGGVMFHWNGSTIESVREAAGYNLLGVWGTGPSDIWAVGERQGGPPAVIHWNGKTWEPVSIPVTLLNGELLFQIWGTDANHVWIITNRGRVLFYDGQSFTVTNVLTEYLWAIWGSSANDVWVAGSRVLHWDGTAWNEMADEHLQNVTALWGSSGRSLWALGAGGLLSRFDGTRWTQVSSADRLSRTAVIGFASNDAWMVGEAGLVQHWDGMRWQSIDVDAKGKTLTDVWGNSSRDLWTVGTQGTVRHFDGNSWQAVSELDPTGGETFRAVWGSAADNVFVCGNSGRIWHWNGKSWKWAMPQNGTVFLKVWGLDSNNVWAVGTLGAVAQWNATQQTWEMWASQPKNEPTLVGIWGTSAADLWVAGSFEKGAYPKPGIHHWNGTGWQSERLPDHSSLFGIFGIDSDHIWLAGPHVWERHDGAWRITDSHAGGRNAVLTGVWGSSPNDLWAVGSYGQVLRKYSPTQPSVPTLRTPQ